MDKLSPSHSSKFANSLKFQFSAGSYDKISETPNFISNNNKQETKSSLNIKFNKAFDNKKFSFTKRIVPQRPLHYFPNYVSIDKY